MKSGQLLITYLLAASAMTALLVFQDKNNNSEINASIRALEIEIQGLSTEFCETINNMHRVRGFEVIDCNKNTVVVRKYDE